MVENNSKDLINNYKMTIIKSDILILGASSFLGKPMVKELEKNKSFNIICQSRKNLKELFLSKYPKISYLEINFINQEVNFQVFSNCSFIINFVNASALNKNELKNFRSFLKNVLLISNASLIHISTASVFGNCKNKIISELSKCNPKNSYQKIKYDDEYVMKKLANIANCKYFIIRPTEIIGNKSLNARKFVKSYISSSFVKRYIIKSFYGRRICHFVSSKYLIATILKIIEGDQLPGTYLVSQDNERSNNFYYICKILDSKIYKKRCLLKMPNYKILSLHWLFKIIYPLFKSEAIPLTSKYISNKPIIDPNKYFYFKKDLLEHINYIFES